MSNVVPMLFQSSILIADDDALSRRFIENALRDRGFSKIYAVESGEKAIEELDMHIQADLIILDILMPGFSGIDCCKWIRAQPKLQGLPILMLTSLTDEKMRVESFAAGASDFISKPLHPEELFARVKVQLENRIAIKDLQHYRKRLQRELSSASELQSAILPSLAEIQDVEQSCKLSIASYLSTSSELGGDFWGMKRLFRHQTAFWAVDFSGHGVAAALNAFHLQAYLKVESEYAARPGDYLSHLNGKLLHLLLRGYFATMFYGVADTIGNRLYYACACSPHPIILHSNGETEVIDGTGTPLGICIQFYPTQSIAYKAGDTLILYSDAYTETPDKSGNCITEKDLQDLLSRHAGKSAEEIKQAMLEYFNNRASLPASDDLSIVIVQRTD